MTAAPPHNLEAEEATLGAVFLSDTILGRLIEEGLQPEHFYRETHRQVYAAMLALFDASERVDPITVAAKGVDEAEVAALAGSVPHAGAFLSYAKTVMECYDLRRKRAGALMVLEGVESRDEDKVADGEGLIAHRVDAEKRTIDADDLRERIYSRVEGGIDPETFPWPWPRLNKLMAGGMRRGQLTLIAAHTRFGKSVVLDQTLEAAAGPGRRVHCYVNEMTADERGERIVSRLARVPFERVQRPSTLEPEHRKRIVNALEHISFGITDCTGWSAQEIARDVLRNRWDVVGIDIFNNMPARKLEDKDEAIRTLAELSRPPLGNCHVLLCAHLSRRRSGQGMTEPMPTLADLRDTGMLERLASNVLFLHRQQDEQTGDPLAPGTLRFGKVRNGRCGGLEVVFMGELMRFDAKVRFADVEREVAAA